MDELYVIARGVLLDALDALEQHLDAIIVVGAHAVYMRVGEADLAVAPHTTDGDLAIDPSNLDEIPPLEQVLTKAGFQRKSNGVGVWLTHRPTINNPHTEVTLDLLVPASVSPGKGRRAAQLPGHDAQAARIVRGLDGIIVDSDIMSVASLHADGSDDRAFNVRVAGPAALLVAKLHKIQDRTGTARSTDKDALDVLRLLQGTTTDELASRIEKVLLDGAARTVALEALDLLERQFSNRAGEGLRMAIRASAGLENPAVIARSCEVLASDLLAAIRR